MWILDKPLLDDAINDIEKIVNASDKLGDAEKVLLNYLARAYDRHFGTITQEDHDKSSKTQREEIAQLYAKTYENGDLYFIRQDLMRNVDLCPMCGIEPPSQLDHQMPISKYGELSVLRLNLVPLCSVCNNRKRAKNPSDFIHPYYVRDISKEPFFIVTIHSSPVTHRMSWQFSINDKVIRDNDLIRKINNQVSVVKLFKRLYKETNRYLSDLLYGMSFNSNKELKTFLQFEYNKNNSRYGRNDWRTAFTFALYVSDKFHKEEAQTYICRIHPVNNGVNA